MRTSIYTQWADELTAALCLRTGLQAPSADMANRAEDRYGARGIDLRAAADEILRVMKWDDVPNNDGDKIQAAFSGGTGNDIFDGLVNAALAAPFRGSRDTTRGWIREREVANFQTNRRMRVRQSGGMPPRPRGGKAEHLQFDTALAEEYRVTQFAQQFTVDQQDLLDDDVEAVTAPAAAIADAALSLKLNLVYLALLANDVLADGVALFAADHSNLATGSALTESNLDGGLSAIELQTENDVPLDTPARYLIVPPAEKGNARRLARSMALNDGRDLRVRSEPRLQNGVMDPETGVAQAGSSTDWYLVAGDGAPTIEFGFLEGRIPRASRWTMNEGAWGVGFAVRWSVGAKALAAAALRKHEA